MKKVHLHRNTRQSWCGRPIKGLDRTYDRHVASCKLCLRADAAEQRKEEAADTRRRAQLDARRIA